MGKMLMKRMGIGSACFFLILVLLMGISSRSSAADTIKIGILAPFSGPFEFVGRQQKAAVDFVVDEQNAKGGLLGNKIETFAEDSENKPDVGVRKAKQLILEKKINLMTTFGGSHVAIALNKLATSYKTLTFSTTSLTDELTGTEFSRYFFRFVHTSYSVTSALAQSMATQPARKYYIICQDYAFGHDAAEGFKKQLKVYVPDAQIVGEDYHPLANKDFAPYISKIIASKADAIFTANWGPDLIVLVKQSRAMGLKAPFPFVTTHGGDPYLLNELKDDGVGIHVASCYMEGVKTPENEEMIKRWHEKYKGEKDIMLWWPTQLIGNTICGWKMIFAALEKAGSLDPEKVVETFEGFSHKTPVGLWTMRKCDHQAIQPMFVASMQAGWNAFYNGSIRADVKFPWFGSDIVTIPGESNYSATSNYNPRCP
jgi:branched-chain amino acid transport system substrate-binding protein